jgi:hypothetical protein
MSRTLRDGVVIFCVAFVGGTLVAAIIAWIGVPS